jgi:putative DNA primase/helicase
MPFHCHHDAADSRVLRELLGRDNVVGPTLSDLAGPFGLQPLLGKSLAVISDARLSGRSDQAVIVQRLLSVSGEDALSVQRKNLPAVTTRLPTRLMIATNELPSLRDASGALTGRLLVLQLRRSFLGQEDTGLLDRLLPELPGILLWAVAGLCRLRQRGRFLQPSSGQVALDQLSELSSPVQAFVEQRCRLGGAQQIPKMELYQAWASWCVDRGSKPGDAATFGRNLLAAHPEINPNARGGAPGRPWLYKGIGLKPVEWDGPVPFGKGLAGPSS